MINKTIISGILTSVIFATATVTMAGPSTKTIQPATQKIQVIEFEARLEGGKKIWAPAELKIEPGKTVELKVHNALPEPHGFTIAGHVEPQTIGAGETKTFRISPEKSEDLKVSCHLHPAHVPATLKVTR